MLVITADRAIDGASDKTKNGEQEQQRGKRSPIVQAANSPSAAPARENPADRPIAEVEKNKKHHEREGQALPYVVENVVTHFMSSDEDDLRRGHLGDGRIPDDDALGRAKSGDVGVQARGLFAGAHPEHTLRRNR